LLRTRALAEAWTLRLILGGNSWLADDLPLDLSWCEACLGRTEAELASARGLQLRPAGSLWLARAIRVTRSRI
jgi:hypothetical protein